MDYPILSYHSHSFLEQLRRHFQNLDTFLNEILPIDEEKFYFLDEHDNRFIHDGVENLLERLRQRLDHQTKERYINEVSEILHVLDKCFSLEGNYGPYDSLSDYDRKNLQNLLFNRIAIKVFFCIIQFIHCSVVLFYPDFIWKESILISGESSDILLHPIRHNYP